MAQTMGFATGGYLAGRLRSPSNDGIVGETTFRDAAQGFVVWAIGVIAMAVVAVGAGYFAASAATRAASGLTTSLTARSNNTSQPASAAPTDYFVDLMFRPSPNGVATANSATPPATDTVGTAAGGPPALNAETRAEATRILVRGVSQGGLDDNDRGYLAQVIAARTGLSPDEAKQRVASVESKAKEAVKETTDKTAKAGAYFSFWTFMSLLFGGVAATLGAMLGGELRDAEGRLVPDVQ
jgi:hypothetical protein